MIITHFLTNYIFPHYFFVDVRKTDSLKGTCGPFSSPKEFMQLKQRQITNNLS